ncbi:uncharacterized protein LOC135164026 isoform X2 [Diachasmimorpha longicaudata]
MQRNEFVTEMNEAIRAGGTLQSVTHHLTERFHSLLTHNAIHQKVRRAMRPTSIPIELDDFANCIKNSSSEDKCVLQESVFTKNGGALIFAIPDVISTIKAESDIIINRVATVLPDPWNADILIIHLVTRKDDLSSTYGCFIAYLKGPSEELYKQVLRKIVTLAPALLSVKTVMTSVDEALRNAVGAIFPEASLGILWCDFVRAVVDLWHDSGLSGSPTKILHHLWVLGAIGKDHLQTGLQFVEKEIKQSIVEFPKLGMLFYVFKMQWEQRLQLLGAPSQVLQLSKRTESFGRYIASTFAYNKNNAEKLTRKLWAGLEMEMVLLKAFEGDENIKGRDKTVPHTIHTSDVLALEKALKEYEPNRVNFESFFLKCFRPSLLTKLSFMGKISIVPQNREMEELEPAPTSKKSRTANVPVTSSGYLKRLSHQSDFDDSVAPSKGGNKRRKLKFSSRQIKNFNKGMPHGSLTSSSSNRDGNKRIDEKHSTIEDTGKSSSDEEKSLFEFDGFIFHVTRK